MSDAEDRAWKKQKRLGSKLENQEIQVRNSVVHDVLAGRTFSEPLTSLATGVLRFDRPQSFFRPRSGLFRSRFFASRFVPNGFDRNSISRPTYLRSSHLLDCLSQSDSIRRLRVFLRFDSSIPPTNVIAFRIFAFKTRPMDAKSSMRNARSVVSESRRSAASAFP